MMKQLFLSVMLWLTGICTTLAIDNNTVEIVYSGTTASVTVASNISQYVTVSSGTSPKVVISQTNTDLIDNDEITYVLSGTSTAGAFQLTGAFKCTVSLAGLQLTNTTGPAITINNGKRVKISAKKDTENTLTAKSNATYNAALWCKGHLELQGNGILNVSDSYGHGIRAKEYLQIKNLTLNITSAAKDGINCREYFWMKSGTVNISNVGSDGIDVSLDGVTSTGEIQATATTEAHDEEDSGNFYQDGGTLNVALASSNTTGSLLQVSGTVYHNAGSFNGTDYGSGISTPTIVPDHATVYIPLSGQSSVPSSRRLQPGIYIYKNGLETKKLLIK